ncbi:glycolipid 2-alpha-mannosyltransferase-domain-containing protein [Fennellomyces sp. T-0311]|nr:glycolipid 2-alpha-mannosyltransferase-domain-containing protein [Fennellomyces sp. T-0311]
MRRTTSLYFFVLLSLCLFYFGSLYLVSRKSEHSACYTVQTNDKSMAQEEVVINPPETEASNDAPVPIYAAVAPELPKDNSNTVATEPVEPQPTYIVKNLTTPGDTRANAVIVILVRNNELRPMRRTIREFEDRFNRKYKYPYVFLNDEPFTEIFKASISALTDAPIEFGLVPDTMWSVPEWVNQTLMNEKMSDMQAQGVLYGGSLSYRHMCRFNSGYFYHHPLLAKYDYYWRVEPGVHFYCDLDYDPFVYMQENDKLYSFTITLKEIPQTIPTIWEHTMKFAHKNNLKTNLLRMFGDEKGYNMCHFWSNFEIASLNLWRDEKYQAYFDYLDSTGNFFYERWGDAIVHSLAAGMFLNKSQVHFFYDIGYKHDNFAHCIDDGLFGKCMCPEETVNFDYTWGSCMPAWNEFPEKGRQWDFKSNGEQVFEDGRMVKNPEYAVSP